MAEPRLATGFWLKALIRRSNMNGIPMVVVAKGDDEAGAVLIKLNRFAEGCTVFSQTRTDAGTPAWLRATGVDLVAEADADAYIERQRRRDPDLWVVEIEDRDGKHCFDEPIL